MLLGFLEKSRYSDCVVICRQQKVLGCPCEVLHACLVEAGTQTMTKLSKKFTDGDTRSKLLELTWKSLRIQIQRMRLKTDILGANVLSGLFQHKKILNPMNSIKEMNNHPLHSKPGTHMI